LGYLGNLIYAILEKIRLKDKKGKWEIFIKKHSGNDRLNGIPYVSVTHKRTEQAVFTNNKGQLVDYFVCTWELNIQFDSLDCNYIHSIYARMVDVSWPGENEVIDNNEKLEVERKLKNIFDEISITNLKEDRNPFKKKIFKRKSFHFS
jgi:hypothetical protein